MSEYQKYEFCEKTFCLKLKDGKCIAKNAMECFKTAKQFHEWLDKNGYQIVKEK